MRSYVRNYCKGLQMQEDLLPYSTVKVAKASSPKKYVRKEQVNKENKEYRQNGLNIQMLSKNLHRQIFQNENEMMNSSLIEKLRYNLEKHGIDINNSPNLEDINIQLPKLKGKNIEDHFKIIAEQQLEPYKKLIESLLPNIPNIPKKWAYTPGMTCYTESGPKTIEYPMEDAFVFDVEICMSAGSAPTIACAVSNKYWYSWVSQQLFDPELEYNKKYNLNNMVPFGKNNVKLIVGHNASFDRARIREQYLLEDTGARFLDTMSLHVCISGVTSYQRAILKANKELDIHDQQWSAQTSLNNLADVYQLYTGKKIGKEPRELFVKGSLSDIRNNFDCLMNYCSNDVKATHDIFVKLYPLFCERFPHPATLAGMLEMGSAYLPVNSNWNRYIHESDLAYEDLSIESRYHLTRRADEACQLLNDNQYKKDLWMWDQDWSVQDLKFKKQKTRNKMNHKCTKNSDERSKDESEKDFQNLYETRSYLPARRPLLPGYPAWYRKLCSKPNSESWHPGPTDLGTGMQITPKLLSLSWEGYPLHYIREKGWGFLVPYRSSHPEGIDGLIPIQELANKCPVLENPCVEANEYESSDVMGNLWKNVERNLSKKDYYKKLKEDKTLGKYTGTGVWCNTNLEGCCWFLKLPHKNGPSFRVGNPLAKDFLNKFSENVLSSYGSSAERVIEIARMLSYWRNNRDRIYNQLIVWLSKENLPRNLQNTGEDYGAIIPQVVVCGTLTRRAMEPTWMTASNALRERVGSELRSMIQAPKGYRLVGADVDSQELWIASILGDSHSELIHGATPLGWMTLSGSKVNETDMHSVTAKAIGISRDHAKVINYARIYGAGQNFAEQLLKQFNPTFSEGEARSKALKMFTMTKGKRVYKIKSKYQEQFNDASYSGYQALKIAAAHGKSVPEMFEKSHWEGGTESEMFNRLEEIAGKEHPVTPFLNCRLSRALEPQPGEEDRFLPTRINWVVQSGAVDFLHLMLICMRWLMNSNVRFCLSFHDEVRYLVKKDLAYKAALALHVTNLLTRAFCSYRLGLNDLPQSVAFFSSVEIDTVLRKDASMDCKTPSNPHGLQAGYGIGKGESLNIKEAIKLAGGSNINSWNWHKSKKNAIKAV